MKKVSTLATKQSRHFSQQKLTIGLDLGDRSSCYCMLDETGKVALEGRVGTTSKAMREVLGRMPRSRVALETGMPIRASRASVCASRRSSLRRLSPIRRTLRACATITSSSSYEQNVISNRRLPTSNHK